MSDIREALSLLVPGAIDIEHTPTADTQAREMLMGALAAIRPQWAADLLLAKYANDAGARRSVEIGLLYDMSGWYVTKPGHKAGTLQTLCAMAVTEHLSAPQCQHCKGTGLDYQLIDSALSECACAACYGRGRVEYTDAERAAMTGLDWLSWAAPYGRLLMILRRMEAAAVLAAGENLQAA